MQSNATIKLLIIFAACSLAAGSIDTNEVIIQNYYLNKNERFDFKPARKTKRSIRNSGLFGLSKIYDSLWANFRCDHSDTFDIDVIVNTANNSVTVRQIEEYAGGGRIDSMFKYGKLAIPAFSRNSINRIRYAGLNNCKLIGVQVHNEAKCQDTILINENSGWIQDCELGGTEHFPLEIKSQFQGIQTTFLPDSQFLELTGKKNLFINSNDSICAISNKRPKYCFKILKRN
jgi:hypothetical protein